MSLIKQQMIPNQCYKCFLTIVIFIVLFIFLYYENNGIVLSRYNIKNKKIPSSFNDFKIIQVSDLHNKVFMSENEGLIKIIKKENPDIIVITGDLVDRRRYNEGKAILLINKLKHIAPIYYVTGNHEAWSGKFSSLQNKLEENEVNVLRNKESTLIKEQDSISILGTDDPAFNTLSYSESYKNYTILKENLQKIDKKDNFKILISHRPELMDLYADEDIDLVFTGHAHGGQFYIPFIGGLIAPNQGFFPKYYKGVYKNKNTFMVVSRGLGNSIIPIRLFNRPEIVSVTLKRD